LAVVLFLSSVLVSKQVAQQSVHPTLGILARFQAFFHASAFSQSDGFAVPRPSAGNANRWQELAVNLSSSFKN